MNNTTGSAPQRFDAYATPLRPVQPPAGGFYQAMPFAASQPVAYIPPASPLERVIQHPATFAQPSPSPATTTKGKQKEKENASYSNHDRKVMAEMLLRDKQISNTQGGHKQEVYQAIAERLNTQVVLGGLKTARSVQTQVGYVFKNYWDPLNKLLQTSGFGWDDEKKCVTASPDVWKAMTEANEWAKEWKDKSWDPFPEWNAYFEGSKAHGKNVVRPGRDFVGLGGRDEGNEAEEGGGEGDLEECDVSTELVPETQRPSSRASTSARGSATGHSNTSKGSTKRKATNSDSVLVLAKSMNRLTDVTEAKMSKRSSKEDRLREAIAHVTLLDYLDQPDQVKVINLLCEQPRKVEGLLAVKGMEIEINMLRSWLGY